MENKDAAIAANFERILLILDCLGPAYEPRQDAVSITSLEEKLEEPARSSVNMMTPAVKKPRDAASLRTP